MRPQTGLSGLVLCGQVTWMFLGLPPPHTHTAVGPGCALTMSWWVLGASVSPNHTVLQQVRQEVSGTSGGPEDMVLSMSVTT